MALSSDFICGFCGETEEMFDDTLDLMEQVRYDMAYMFAYSLREKTHAHRRMEDDVPEPVKKDRLSRMIEVFKRRQMERQIEEIGRIHEVLVDKRGRDEGQLSGLTDTNKRVILSDGGCQIGDMIKAKVTHVGQNTLFVDKI